MGNLSLFWSLTSGVFKVNKAASQPQQRSGQRGQGARRPKDKERPEEVCWPYPML